MDRRGIREVTAGERLGLLFQVRTYEQNLLRIPVVDQDGLDTTRRCRDERMHGRAHAEGHDMLAVAFDLDLPRRLCRVSRRDRRDGDRRGERRDR